MTILGFNTIALSPGSYLFHGQEMIGKKSFSLQLARDLADSADIIMVQSDIDSVREMKRFLSLSPLNGDYKIAIVDNAHNMQEEAQNALLKILEEPTASSILILISSQPESLLQTITSRCRQIFFPPHKPETVRAFLKERSFTKEQEDFLVQFCNGSIGLLANQENIKEFIQEYSVLAKATLDQKFTLAKKLADDEKLQQKILYWMLYLRSKNIYKPLQGLLALHKTISQPQFNKQLALENFMLQLL
ncbi:MAG: hypothetical protein AAB420_01300 [Patescibacteria group bacterium]